MGECWRIPVHLNTASCNVLSVGDDVGLTLVLVEQNAASAKKLQPAASWLRLSRAPDLFASCHHLSAKVDRLQARPLPILLRCRARPKLGEVDLSEDTNNDSEFRNMLLKRNTLAIPNRWCFCDAKTHCLSTAQLSFLRFYQSPFLRCN